VPPPELGSAPRDYSDPSTEAYAFMVGPSSLMHDPNTGAFFKLDVVFDQTRFEVKQRAPEGWREKDDQNPGTQPFLELMVAGCQRRVVPAGDGSPAYEDTCFVWKVPVWAAGEIKSGDTTRWKESEMNAFAITSLHMWKTLMPVYFPLMDAIYVVHPNRDRTSIMMAELKGGTSARRDAAHGATVDEDGQLVMPREDRLGLFTDNAGDDDAHETLGGMDAMMDEDEAPEAETGSADAEDDDAYDADAPNIDFARNFYLDRIEFDAATFWKRHGLQIPRDVAKGVVAMTRHEPSTLEIDPEFAAKSANTLRQEARERARVTANKILDRTDCICVSDKFPEYGVIFNPKLGGIKCFVAVVPWANYTPEYAKHIAAMTPAMQTSLFIHLYDLYNKLTTKTAKRTEEQVQRNATIFAPPHALDSPEWEASGAAYIYSREADLRETWRTATPGVFAIYDDDPEKRARGKQSLLYLLGDHPDQADLVEKVRAARDAAPDPATNGTDSTSANEVPPSKKPRLDAASKDDAKL